MRAERQRRGKSLRRGAAFGIFSGRSRAAGAMSGHLKASAFFRLLRPVVTPDPLRSRKAACSIAHKSRTRMSSMKMSVRNFPARRCRSACFRFATAPRKAASTQREFRASTWRATSTPPWRRCGHGSGHWYRLAYYKREGHCGSSTAPRARNGIRSISRANPRPRSGPRRSGATSPGPSANP